MDISFLTISIINRRHHPFQHKFEFILDKLEPLTQYQVILKAR